MPRIARILVDGMPHHITQRGNRKQKTFFSPSDYYLYRSLLIKWSRHYCVEVWAYCLMPNHVHLMMVAEAGENIRNVLREVHRRYTRIVNLREGWRGHLWQGRFSSFVMDERYTIACARYIELNPVKAGLVRRPQDYHWSSAKSHLGRSNDDLINRNALLDLVPDWSQLLDSGISADEIEEIEKHERTGRPLGPHEFLSNLEEMTGLRLIPKPPGPQPRVVS